MKWFGLAGVLALVGCAPHDEGYYRTHPTALIDVLKQCPDVSPKDVSCEQLHPLAQEMRNMTEHLQQDPQAFGQRIIALQVACAKPDVRVKDKDACEQDLAMRLAVVKWLESPES